MPRLPRKMARRHARPNHTLVCEKFMLNLCVYVSVCEVYVKFVCVCECVCEVIVC